MKGIIDSKDLATIGGTLSGIFMVIFLFIIKLKIRVEIIATMIAEKRPWLPNQLVGITLLTGSTLFALSVIVVEDGVKRIKDATDATPALKESLSKLFAKWYAIEKAAKRAIKF